MLKANSGTSLISLALFVLACSTSSVQAQEIEKKWESYFSMGEPRSTEAAVQKDIRAFFAEYEVDKPFVWEVKRQRALPNKTIYDYRVKPEKIVTTDWVYEQNHQKYATEDAVRSMFLSKNASDPRCAATVMTEEAWEEVGGLGVGDDGSVINESKRYKFVKNSYYEGTKACSELVFGNTPIGVEPQNA